MYKKNEKHVTKSMRIPTKETKKIKSLLKGLHTYIDLYNTHYGCNEKNKYRTTYEFYIENLKENITYNNEMIERKIEKINKLDQSISGINLQLEKIKKVKKSSEKSETTTVSSKINPIYTKFLSSSPVSLSSYYQKEFLYNQEKDLRELKNEQNRIKKQIESEIEMYKTNLKESTALYNYYTNELMDIKKSIDDFDTIYNSRVLKTKENIENNISFNKKLIDEKKSRKFFKRKSIKSCAECGMISEELALQIINPDYYKYISGLNSDEIKYLKKNNLHEKLSNYFEKNKK